MSSCFAIAARVSYVCVGCGLDLLTNPTQLATQHNTLSYMHLLHMAQPHCQSVRWLLVHQWSCIEQCWVPSWARLCRESLSRKTLGMPVASRVWLHRAQTTRGMQRVKSGILYQPFCNLIGQTQNSRLSYFEGVAA